jgi:predicted nucleotidyltransferase
MMPIMGSRRSTRPPPGREALADVLFSATQQRVFGLVFGQPDRAFTLSEIIGLARSGSGAVQREMRRLAGSGLVLVANNSGRKWYRANRDAPIFAELASIIEKTVGVPEQLRASLTKLLPHISLAIFYGSMAKGDDTALSDVDVLIVSDDLTLEEVFAALAVAEKRLGRRVSPTLYTRAEFRRRRREKHPFLTKVLAGKHIVLFGDADAAEAAR